MQSTKTTLLTYPILLFCTERREETEGNPKGGVLFYLKRVGGVFFFVLYTQKVGGTGKVWGCGTANYTNSCLFYFYVFLRKNKNRSVYSESPADVLRDRHCCVPLECVSKKVGGHIFPLFSPPQHSIMSSWHKRLPINKLIFYSTDPPHTPDKDALHPSASSGMLRACSAVDRDHELPRHW